MTPDQKAHELGLTFPKKERGYLNLSYEPETC